MRSRPAVVTLAVVAVVVLGSVTALDRRASAGGATPAPAPAPTPALVRRLIAPHRPPVTIAVRTDERVVALSFDDGPDPRWTPAVLDALAAAGARATFFVTGEHTRAHPDLVRRAAAEGHEIANHTDTHPLLDRLAPAAVTAEVDRAHDAIAATGVQPAPYFRPPKGRYDASTLAGVAPTDHAIYGWTVCFERWLRSGTLLGVEETVARVQPGGIIVSHDGGIPDRSRTVAGLPFLLDRLHADGYRVVTIGELERLGSPIAGRPGEWRPPPLP